MKKEIAKLINNLKCSVQVLEDGIKDEYRQGQIDMANNIIFELQKIYLEEIK